MTLQTNHKATASDLVGRPGPRPHVCLIVVTYNAELFISDCLASLLDQSYPADRTEVIVVDNASTDSTVQILSERYPDVELIANPRNLGFARANNLAIRRTDTDFIALVNADAVLERTWLERMVEGMTSDPAIAVGGCKIYYPDGLLQHVGGIIHGNGLTDHQRAFEADVGQYDEPRDLDHVTGLAVMPRRESAMAYPRCQMTLRRHVWFGQISLAAAYSRECRGINDTVTGEAS